MSRRIRLVSVAALGILAMALGVSSSSAGVPQGTTEVQINGIETDPDNDFSLIYGRVFAQPQQCAKNREVQFQVNEGSGFETIDAGPTSRRAYYVLAAPASDNAVAARVVAPASKIKVGGNTVKCKRAQEDLAAG